jgi:hypothetical protein
MSYQYCFCPACGTRRAAYDYRCSICGGLVRRTTVIFRSAPRLAELLSWKPTVQTDAAFDEQPPTAA